MAAFSAPNDVQPVVWKGDGLYVLDQRLLPGEERWDCCDHWQQVFDAIRDMRVRGAPAIGIAAAYGVVLAARDEERRGGNLEDLGYAINALRDARPTAVNLFWALDRMARLLRPGESLTALVPVLEAEAVEIHREDADANRRMGALAADHMLREESGSIAVLTHCNTGALATGGYGTALGVIRSLWQRHRLERVYADETRPWLQGSRLTAWELRREGLPVTLNADGAAAALMQQGRVRWVVVGADRITANGDAANKIGTYSLAVLARHHGVGFMVVAPSSTVDMATACGQDIAIEERDGDELRMAGDRRVAPAEVAVWNPVFDVTPADLIDAIVTEQGVIAHPNRERMGAHFS